MLQAAEAARLYERVHAVVDARGHDRLGESLDLLLEHEAAQRLRTCVRGVTRFGSFFKIFSLDNHKRRFFDK